ncbi:hypothetical protein Tco_1377085 [Tanacetum coccineum]
MQKQENKIDTGKAVDADLVVTESIRTTQQCIDDTQVMGWYQILMMQISDPFYDESKWLRVDLSTEVHQVAETVTTSNELDLLFDPLFDEYFNGENQVVLKSSAVTTTDASNKRQQPDSTSSTSTLATTVTADGNFDL